MQEAKRILPQDLKTRIDRGDVTVLDVRRGSWNQSDQKIPGAIRIDPDRYQDYVGALPQGKPVVTYCT